MERAVNSCKIAAPARRPIASRCVVVTTLHVCLNQSVSEPVKSAWDGYRRWRRWEYAPIAVWLIIVLFPQCVVIAFPLFAALIAVLAVKVTYFNCPQCGNPFFYGSGFIAYKGWAKACVHCGHPKWAEPVPKQPSSDPHPWPRPKVGPDPEEKKRDELRVFLTLVLASDPASIGVKLDDEGWADLDQLISLTKRNGLKWTHDQILEVASRSKNPVFELDPSGRRIRCIRR